MPPSTGSAAPVTPGRGRAAQPGDQRGRLRRLEQALHQLVAGELLGRGEAVDGGRRIEHRSPGRARAHRVGGDAGAGQVGGEGAHQPDHGVLRRAVGAQARQPEQPGGRGHGHHASLARRRRLQQGRHGGGGQVAHAVDVDVELRVPLGVGRLPQRRAAADHAGGGDGRLQPPEVPDRLVHRGTHVRRAAHVAHHGAHGGAVARRHLLQVGLGGEGVVQRRIVGAAVHRHHLPPGGHERIDRRRADAPRRTGDDRGRAHEGGQCDDTDAARSLTRASSSARPSSALAPVGSPSTPLDDTGRTPSARRRGSNVASGSVQPGSASSRRTTAGSMASSKRRLRPAGVRVPARPSRRARRARRRPRRRSAARADDQRLLVAAVRVDEHHAGEGAAGGAHELDEQVGQDLVADEERAGEVGVLAAGPVGHGGRHGDARAARRQPGRDGDGDAGVGVEGEVRPVLLERAQRDRQHACAPRSPPPGARWRRRAPRAQVRAGERKRTGVGTGIGRPVPRHLGVAERRLRPCAPRRQRGLAVPVHALGVGPVEGQAGEELGRHAPAAAGVERTARRAGPRALRLAQRGEERRLAPDGGKASGVAHVAGEELAVDDERAGVDVADGVDEADDPPRPAEVQAVERLAQRREVEEGVARQHARALEQPVVERALLRRRRVQARPRCRRPRPEGRSRVRRSWAP